MPFPPISVAIKLLQNVPFFSQLILALINNSVVLFTVTEGEDQCCFLSNICQIIIFFILTIF